MEKARQLRDLRAAKRRKSRSRLDLIEEKSETAYENEDGDSDEDDGQPKPRFNDEEMEPLDRVHELYEQSGQYIKWYVFLFQVVCRFKFILFSSCFDSQSNLLSIL